jgi:hypothetical protein
MKRNILNINHVVLVIIFLTGMFFPQLQARIINVSSIAALQTAINNSIAGDTIVLANGTYTNSSLSISKSNIMVKTASPGGVYLSGTQYITIDGNYVTFSGFQFTSGDIGTGYLIIVYGSHNILTQLNFNGYSAKKYVVFAGGSQYNELSFCNFQNKPTTAPIGNLVHIDPDISIPGYNRIRYCSFQKMPGLGGDNGNECIRISNGATSTYVSRTIVEYCYFDSTGPGDSEVISVKCRENVIRFCTNTNNQQGNFCFRNGDNNIAYGNFFINAGGIRLKEANNIYCYNNYFENCGDGNISAPVKYVYVSPNLNNLNFIHNTFIDGTPIELDPNATSNTWTNNVFKKSSGNIFTGSAPGISWAGNIYQGTLGISIPSGMTNANPQLVLNSDGYLGLSSSSPAIDAASASYPSILDIANVDDDPTLLFDISGQSRPATITQKDVGCDEYTTGSITNRPLTLPDVGPSYLGGPTNHTITAISGSNGSISPSGVVTVNYGTDQTFNINPSFGYNVDSVFVDGVSQPVTPTYTFLNVKANHTIRVVFRLNIYTITATAGENGLIDPSGAVTVNHGSNKVFMFDPSTGYHIDSVIVDGLSKSVASSYTFINVQTNHTIRVVFGIDTFTITATAGENGSIIPSGVVTVNYGTNQKFTFNPLSNYSVDSVIVDGTSQMVDSIYTFTHIQANHTIRVSFSINIQAVTVDVQGHWNLISLPLYVPDPKKTSLFPMAVSDAFAYSSGYVKKESLSVGTGYWLKFDSVESVNIPGTYRLRDTIDVVAGWNLIGSISQVITASSIVSEPGGMVASQFFGYSNGYQNTDSIYPGKGYWVKVNQTGKFILTVSGVAQSSKAIRIERISEFPPPSPDGMMGEAVMESLPTEFSLNQNYPNPFNPTTVIKYQLPTNNFVTLKVYNMLGQEVAGLVNEIQGPGYMSFEWNAKYMPSGLYLVKLCGGNYIKTIKVLLLK